MKRAVFLDRDGVFNQLVDRGETFRGMDGQIIRFTAPFTLKELKMKPDVFRAVDIIRDKRYLPILVTNQPDVATGHMKSHDFEAIMNVFRFMPFGAIYVCTHRPDAGCACRKPRPGMLMAARDQYEIDMGSSWMIGDMESDVLAGKAAGVRTIRITDGDDKPSVADLRAQHLYEAVQHLPM